MNTLRAQLGLTPVSISITVLSQEPPTLQLVTAGTSSRLMGGGPVGDDTGPVDGGDVGPVVGGDVGHVEGGDVGHVEGGDAGHMEGGDAGPWMEVIQNLLMEVMCIL